VSVSLASRQGREDLSREELIRTAAASAFDTCHIETTSGDMTIVWRYGPSKAVPMVFGVTEASTDELHELERLLIDLCVESNSSYAICDLETARFQLEDGTDPYISRGLFLDLYWWNYFGSEYAKTLVVSARVDSSAVRTTSLPHGATTVLTRSSPTEVVEKQRIQAIAAEWPVFLRWNRKAQRSVDVNYSEVRTLAPAPVPAKRKIVDFVGPADEFISSVPEHARRFMEWATTKGLQPKTEDDFRRALRENRSVIRDEYLAPAVAAYGEAVRQRLNGEWTKALWFGRGEPVVGRVGRPWSRRRVIYEVLEALEEEIP
jgi:hypothetical protein